MSKTEEKALDKSKSTNGTLALSDLTLDGYELVQIGGVTKWVDIDSMDKSDCLEGVLVGKQSIEDDDDRLRYIFSFKLLRPCRVTYKNENDEKVSEFAEKGEIVALGERSKLSFLKGLSDDGGMYALLIQPHTKISIRGGKTVWTFNVAKKTLRAPTRQQEKM